MIQLLEFIFGETAESGCIQREDEINSLAQYVVKKINEIDIQIQNFKNNQQGFVYQYGIVYIDTCNQIEKEFKLKSPHNYIWYKQKIEIMIAKKIRTLAKLKQQVMYKAVLQQIKYKQIDIPLEKNQNICSLNKLYQQHYLMFVQNIYKSQPKTMNWILIKYEEKMKKHLTYQLIEQQRTNSNQFNYKKEVTDYIHTYLITQQFWLLNKDYIINLIQFVYQLNKSKFQEVQQGLSKFILELSSLNQFKLDENDIQQIFGQKNQNLQKYFFEDFTAKQTIQFLVEIFILLSGFKFQNHSLFIDKYQSSSHAFLLKFCEQINNGKWDFTNSQILKLADKVIGDIHYQIVQQLNLKFQNKVIFQAFNNYEQIVLFGNNEQALSNFKLKNLAYYYSSQYQITASQNKIDEILNNYFSIFINKIVQLKPKDLEKYRKPEIFYLQSLSKGQLRSNVITIFVNGFITQKKQNLEKLWPFNQDSYLETLVLGWSASCISTIFKFTGLSILFCDPFVTFTAGAILGAGKLLSQFNTAFQEAKIVGKYLAYFLDQNQLGIKAVNLIGFSLGTVIVYYQQDIDKTQLIHNVLMMGGVADKNLLQQLDFRCISGTFHNVYSEKDIILSLVLPIYNKAITPCGLNPVYSMHPNVKNHNFTKKVSGHTYYEGEIISQILKLTNFDDQYFIF
ncbi:unnamed protein product [Paramecium pentaurelia]|uniref:Transmembrane protein n=1 Tax=Paramecium pentaurelia TaxID=43138 RepID=A0A8S1RVX8_9CILI|nr:unnamed protein product [Paramecium pentaurelia]